MDSSFNEDELADIMSEIENLEEGGAEAASTPQDDEPLQFDEEMANDLAALEGEEVDVEVKEADAVTASGDLFDQMQAEQEQVSEEPVAEEPDFSEDPEAEEEPLLESTEEPVMASEDDDFDLDSIRAEVESEPEIPAEATIAEVHELPSRTPNEQSWSPGQGAQTSLSFKVTGELDLKLDFNVGGQDVSLYVSEKEGLVIELPNGGKFNLPLDNAKKKAA